MNTITLISLIALAIAPGIAIAVLVYFYDKYEKEPFRLLVKCFFFGVLSVIPVILIGYIQDMIGFREGETFLRVLLYAFIGVGLVEELSKFVFLRLGAYRHKAFNEPFDGIVYAVMIAMGFATAENIMYCVEYGWTTAVLRLFTAVPMHATCGVIMGYYLGLAKFNPAPVRFMFLGLFFATIMHGAYDFFLMQQDYPALTLLSAVALAVSVSLSFVAMRSHQRNSPFRNA